MSEESALLNGKECCVVARRDSLDFEFFLPHTKAFLDSGQSGRGREARFTHGLRKSPFCSLPPSPNLKVSRNCNREIIAARNGLND